MAKNLAKKGFPLTIYDRSEQAVNGLTETLAKETRVLPVKKAMQVSEHADVVITMLPANAHVEEVYLGPQGLLSASSQLKPKIFLDSSTIDPNLSRQIAKKASSKGLYFLDAPVSGG